MDEYKQMYEAFVTNYRRADTSAEQIGELIMKMAQYYSDINLRMGTQGDLLNRKAAEIINADDPATGKSISVAKAEVLTAATVENALYDKTKRDLQNVEQMINALKSLQKGVLNEYSHAGGL